MLPQAGENVESHFDSVVVMCCRAWSLEMTGGIAFSREDGSKQWAYKGKPLYYFAMDTSSGDKKGDGRGMVWHIAKP